MSGTPDAISGLGENPKWICLMPLSFADLRTAMGESSASFSRALQGLFAMKRQIMSVCET